jgi:hypothetical protein
LLPHHPFFPAIFTEQMQLELLKVASSVYKYMADGASRPLCHPTSSLVLFFVCKSSAILWEVPFLAFRRGRRHLQASVCPEFWNSRAIETELVSSAGFQIS